MKIKSIRSRLEKVSLKRPYEISYERFDSVTLLFVELTLDNGLIGFGSASPAYSVTQESISDCHQSLSESTLAYLIGMDIRCVHGLLALTQSKLRHTPAAAAAVDMALYDAYAKLMEQPLARLLGQRHKSLATSVTVGINEHIPEILDEVAEYISQGFKVLKIKTGLNWSHDVEMLFRIREQVGRDVKVRIDPNQAYSIDDLKQFLAASEPLDLEFIEQPIARKDQMELRHLTESQRQAIALDESIHNVRDAIDVLSPSPLGGIYNIKLMKCGGITPALKIADVATAYDIQLMWGCMDESIISISAALHAAFCCPQTRYLDLDGSFDLAQDFVSGGFILQDGMMSVSERPGLGVEPIC